MIMTSHNPWFQPLHANPRSLTRKLGPVGYRRVGGLGGLGATALNFGANGQIDCTGLDSSLCNADVLQQGLAYAWGKPLSQVNQQCNVNGISGAGCTGYLQNVAQWLQNGNVVSNNGQFSWCGPGGGTWSGPVTSTCSPVAPSQLARTAYAAAYANSPFTGGPSVARTYSGQQASPLFPAPPQPTVVNPSPATQLSTTGSSYTAPASLLSQATGTVSTPGTLASTVGGLLPISSSTDTASTLIPGLPDWMVIAAGVLIALIIATRK